MDFLAAQQRETKRNSRLAFLYDLEKEIRALERYIRRLEFQISKVEELYETYCIQWRLCQGAVNMRRAFSLSPSTRASRESLLELSRNHRLSLQDMSSMEGELEILLGELQIKMKGLIGFARLCPGDQYEVVVRVGRQRWRIRGRIESDDTQTWDQEVMAFLPHINHNFHIKVTEAKGLGWQLVGSVTCASADFFVSKPWLMLVDITELGTIKLQLEVSWNPFDSSEKMRPLSISRQSVSSRKSSVYSWTAPNTPSFTEKYFMSMVRELQDTEGSLPSLVPKSRPPRGGVSLLSYLSHQSQASIPSSHSPHSSSTPMTNSYPSSPSPGTSLGDSRSQLSLDGGSVRESPEEGRTRRRSEEGEEEEEETTWARSTTPDQSTTGSLLLERALSRRLGALITHLEKSLQNNGTTEKELRALDHHLLHLATILKNDLSLLRSSCSEETLAVEEVLGSFDFLSHDLNADEDTTSCLGSIRLKDSGISSIKESTLRSLGMIPRDTASQEELGVAPLTSGNWSLDQALETHLDICCSLLQVLRVTDSAPSRQDLLEEVSLQTEALDKINSLLLQKNDNISAEDILPKAQKTRDLLQFWEDCADNVMSAPFCCHADSFSRSLRKRYTHKVKAKQPGQSERVFAELVQQVVSVCRAVPSPWTCASPERLTVFQLSLYMKRWSISDLGEHISQLSKEEYILWSLRGPKRRKALNKLKQRHFCELLPLRQTLHTLGSLQTDPHHKVCKAAANCLSRAANNKSFRKKAVVYFTESLKSSDALVQQCSCLALKCLRGTESVDYIAELWRSSNEDVRSAARETILSFGKKGHAAFQKMDQIDSELQEEAYRNLETEITIL
ncbi:hypothetical protein NQD34_003366 [Periophthalmus magnuspinnatus]|nr:hypothetical protein NQD34_003366 [Periophthalmus magnuspinnatus]